MCFRVFLYFYGFLLQTLIAESPEEFVPTLPLVAKLLSMFAQDVRCGFRSFFAPPPHLFLPVPLTPFRAHPQRTLVMRTRHHSAQSLQLVEVLLAAVVKVCTRGRSRRGRCCRWQWELSVKER